MYSHQEYVYVRVALLEVPLPKFTPKIGQTLQKAFQTFYKVDIQGMYICIKNMQKFNINRIYEADLLTENSTSIKSSSEDELQSLYHKLMDRRKSLELPPLERKHLKFLRPALRPYQEQAVRWMMDRENRSSTCGKSII